MAPSQRGEHHGTTRTTSQRGLTLIEACATLTVMGILAGSALPAFDGVTGTRRIEGQAAEVAVDLHYVRSDAVSRNERFRVSFHDVAGGSCTLIHAGATADCSCSSTGAAQCTNGATALKTLFSPSALVSRSGPTLPP